MSRPYTFRIPRKYLSDLKPGTMFTARGVGQGIALKGGEYWHCAKRKLVSNPVLQTYPI
jgi:hypothetical protein